ncbi:MAG: hypothetical protein Q8M08_07345 [Bacteroidales bacterium]|nr:hypothetical protein [Bacteroidales bacterium]
MNTYKLQENTLLERIRLHYLEDYEISKADADILARWEAAHALVLDSSDTDQNIVKILMKRFDISNVCAYNDIRNSKNFFGDVRSSNKQGIRYIVTQWAIDLFRMAKHAKDLIGMAKAMERITKANNLDIDDMNIPDVTKIQPPVQLLSLNFDFINSPRFKLIDDAAQKALLQLYEEFMAQVMISPLAEYADVWKINDSVRPDKKRRGPAKNKACQKCQHYKQS